MITQKQQGYLIMGAAGLAGLVVVGAMMRRTATAAAQTVKKAAAVVGDSVNPTSSGNIIYRGVNAVGDVLDNGNSADNSFNLGIWIYDILHPEDYTAVTGGKN